MTKPHELHRFFDKLEFHFVHTQLSAEQECKTHTLRFLDMDMADLWESIMQYTDTTMTYTAFKKAVFKLYPGSENKYKWSNADLMHLVEESMCIGVHSLGDLGNYYHQSLTLTVFLCTKGRLSENKQNH